MSINIELSKYSLILSELQKCAKRSSKLYELIVKPKKNSYGVIEKGKLSNNTFYDALKELTKEGIIKRYEVSYQEVYYMLPRHYEKFLKEIKKTHQKVEEKTEEFPDHIYQKHTEDIKAFINSWLNNLKISFKFDQDCTVSSLDERSYEIINYEDFIKIENEPIFQCLKDYHLKLEKDDFWNEWEELKKKWMECDNLKNDILRNLSNRFYKESEIKFSEYDVPIIDVEQFYNFVIDYIYYLLIIYIKDGYNKKDSEYNLIIKEIKKKVYMYLSKKYNLGDSESFELLSFNIFFKPEQNIKMTLVFLFGMLFADYEDHSHNQIVEEFHTSSLEVDTDLSYCGEEDDNFEEEDISSPENKKEGEKIELVIKNTLQNLDLSEYEKVENIFQLVDNLEELRDRIKNILILNLNIPIFRDNCKFIKASSNQ